LRPIAWCGYTAGEPEGFPQMCEEVVVELEIETQPLGNERKFCLLSLAKGTDGWVEKRFNENYTTKQFLKKAASEEDAKQFFRESNFANNKEFEDTPEKFFFDLETNVYALRKFSSAPRVCRIALYEFHDSLEIIEILESGVGESERGKE
jgi:hypothetical protein